MHPTTRLLDSACIWGVNLSIIQHFSFCSGSACAISGLSGHKEKLACSEIWSLMWRCEGVSCSSKPSSRKDRSSSARQREASPPDSAIKSKCSSGKQHIQSNVNRRRNSTDCQAPRSSKCSHYSRLPFPPRGSNTMLRLGSVRSSTTASLDSPDCLSSSCDSWPTASLRGPSDGLQHSFLSVKAIWLRLISHVRDFRPITAAPALQCCLERTAQQPDFRAQASLLCPRAATGLKTCSVRGGRLKCSHRYSWTHRVFITDSSAAADSAWPPEWPTSARAMYRASEGFRHTPCSSCSPQVVLRSCSCAVLKYDGCITCVLRLPAV